MELLFSVLTVCKSCASFCDANVDVSLLLQQATAEQIRLAQMISDHNDADFEEKVKQVKNALHSFVTLYPHSDSLITFLVTTHISTTMMYQRHV